MTSIPVSDEEIIEKPSAEMVSDPETGEVILGFNEEIQKKNSRNYAESAEKPLGFTIWTKTCS